jgi:hypothetical protein
MQMEIYSYDMLNKTGAQKKKGPAGSKKHPLNKNT